MALDSTLALTGTALAISPPLPSTPSSHRYRDAYEQALPASLALKPEDIIGVNLDVQNAVTTTVGKLPAILALRGEVAKHLPTFDLSSFDLLETYTLALAHAHVLFRGASEAPAQLAALNEQGLRLRDVLSTDAQALAKHELINGSRLKALKANVGYKNLAFDLFALAALLRASWDRIDGKTAIQIRDLDYADSLGEQLIDALASRMHAPSAYAAQSQQRARNFTLFSNTYGEVRRAVTYLRWHEGDADRIAPSLYSGRGAGNRRKERVEGQAAQPVGQVDASGHEIGPGLPGVSPFVSN